MHLYCSMQPWVLACVGRMSKFLESPATTALHTMAPEIVLMLKSWVLNEAGRMQSTSLLGCPLPSMRVIICCAGVISVAVFGLYGAATSKWELSAKVQESGAFDAFWDSIAFIANAIVFFYSGVACINFFVR